jgi:pimeloyl-ACP methyl ester carboxylesterase
MIRSALALALCIFLFGCVESQTPPDSDDGATDGSDDGGDDGGDGGDDGAGFSIEDAITYRDLASHPGCSTADMSYAAGGPDGYQCAGKAYPADSEDTAKPIVLLVHGNSDTPDSWERWPKETGMPQIAETLSELGHRTYAIDLRIDLVDDPGSNNDTENAARNVDHGWSTPLAQRFIASALEAEPDRRFVLIGFSLGSTIIRDALRRLHLEAQDGGTSPWPQLERVILLAGAHHGVSTFARLCGKNPTMRGQVACELGSRDNYAPTDFLSAINGPDGAYETPCSDGDSAFGEADACGGNTVAYTTAVMRDIADGSYQDEFVSESSSSLKGADNHLLELTDTDDSGYFFEGLLKNHYGASRSQAALDIVVEALEAP